MINKGGDSQESTEPMQVPRQAKHHLTEDHLNTKPAANVAKVNNFKKEDDPSLDGSSSQMVFKFRSQADQISENQHPIISQGESSKYIKIDQKVQEIGNQYGVDSQVSDDRESMVRQLLQNVYQNASVYDYQSRETNLEIIERQIEQNLDGSASSSYINRIDSQGGSKTNENAAESVIGHGKNQSSGGQSRTELASQAFVIHRQIQGSQETSIIDQYYTNAASNGTDSVADRAHIVNSQQNNYQFDSEKEHKQEINRLSTEQSNVTNQVQIRDQNLVIMKHGSQEINRIHSQTDSRVMSNQVILKETHNTAHGESTVEEDGLVQQLNKYNSREVQPFPQLIQEEEQKEDSAEIDDAPITAIDLQKISRMYPQVASEEDLKKSTNRAQENLKFGVNQARDDSIEDTEQCLSKKESLKQSEKPSDKNQTGSYIPSGRSDLMSSSQNQVKTQRTNKSGDMMGQDTMNPNDVPLEYTQTLDQHTQLLMNNLAASSTTEGLIETNNALFQQSQNQNVQSSIELVKKQVSSQEQTPREQVAQSFNAQTFRDENLIHANTSVQKEVRHLKDILTRNNERIVATDEAYLSDLVQKQNNTQNTAVEKQPTLKTGQPEAFIDLKSSQDPMQLSKQMTQQAKGYEKMQEDDEQLLPQDTDKLLHRLPNNYFVQDQDEEDLDMVISNIDTMRAQMLSYVQTNQIDSALSKDLQNIANIQDILHPEKFIEKHYPTKVQKKKKQVVQSKEEEVIPPKISQQLQQQEETLAQLKSDLNQEASIFKKQDEQMLEQPSQALAGSPRRSETEHQTEGFEAEPPKFLFEEILKDSPKTAKKALKEELEQFKIQQARLEEEKKAGELSQIDQDEESNISKSLTTGHQQSRNATSTSQANRALTPTQNVDQEEQAQDTKLSDPVEEKAQEAESQELQPEIIKQVQEPAAHDQTHEVDFWAEDNELSGVQPDENLTNLEEGNPQIQPSATSHTLEEQQLDKTLNESHLIPDQQIIDSRYHQSQIDQEQLYGQPYDYTADLQQQQQPVRPKPIAVSGPRVMKMADYFKGEPGYNGESAKGKPNIMENMETIGRNTTYQVDPQVRELTAEEEQRLEREVLNNVDINFLFSQGKGLTECLIDSRRVFQIVEKIKELAKEQLAKGSKDIDYEALVKFLKSKDHALDSEKEDSFAEPQFEPTLAEQDEQWQKTLSFMRNNPKLLMEMIPGTVDDKETQDIADRVSNQIGLPGYEHKADHIVLKRSRVYDKIYEAQQWQQLQKLSSSFNQKRKNNTALAQSKSAAVASNFDGKPKTRFAMNEKPPLQIQPSMKTASSKPWKLTPLATNLSPENQIRKLGYYHGKGKQAPLAQIALEQSKPPKKSKPRPRPQKIEQPESQLTIDRNHVISPQSDYQLPLGSKRSQKKESNQANSQAVSQMGQLDEDGKMRSVKIKRRPSQHIEKQRETKYSSRREKGSLFSIKNHMKERRKSAKGQKQSANFQSEATIEAKRNSKDALNYSMAIDSSQAKITHAAHRSATQNIKEGPVPQKNNFLAENSNTEQTESMAPEMKLMDSLTKGVDENTESQPIDIHIQKAKNYQISDLMSMNSKSQIGIQSDQPRNHQVSRTKEEYPSRKMPKIRSSKSHVKSKRDQVKVFSTKSEVEKSFQSNLDKLPAEIKAPKKFLDITSSANNRKMQMSQQQQLAHDQADFSNDQQGCITQKNQLRFRKQNRAMTAKAKPILGKSRQLVPPASNTNYLVGFPQVDRGVNASQAVSNHPLNMSNVLSNKSGMPMEQDTSHRNSRSNFMSGMTMNKLTNVLSKDQILSSNMPKFIKPVDFSNDGSGVRFQKYMFYKPVKFNPLKKNKTQKAGSLSADERTASRQAGARNRSTSRESRSKRKQAEQIPKIHNVMMFQSISDNELLKTIPQDGIKNSRSPKRTRSRSKRKRSRSNKKKSLSPAQTKTKIMSSRELKILQNSGSRKQSSNSRRTKSPKSPALAKFKNMMPVQKVPAQTSTTELQEHEMKQLSTKVQKSSIYDKKMSLNLNSSKNSATVFPRRRSGSGSLKKRKKSSHSKERARETVIRGQIIDETLTNFSSKATKAKYCQEMSVQTDIRGVEHKILVQPDKFDAIPYVQEEPPSDVGKLNDETASHQGSQITTEKKRQQHYKVPVIDWSATLIYNNFQQSGNPFTISQELNSKNETMRYSETEVDSILNLIKSSYNDFKRTDIMKPFYFKALDTLSYLLSEQSVSPIFQRVQEEYKEITLENTMKLLIRCKMTYNSRNMLIQMFQDLNAYFNSADEIKRLIEVQSGYKVEKEVFEQLRLLAEKVLEDGVKLLKQAEVMSQSSHRQFKGKPFVFKNIQDISLYVRQEVNQIRRLVFAFKVKKKRGAFNDDIRIINEQIEGEKDRILMISKSGFFEEEQNMLLEAVGSSSSDD